ncbi:MAG: Bro-N domain-containing protein [Candidatus Falkowbacteria bacterium]|nr:Bro-N domain-containing protein [Candidatus Falkowbacteria bacterium]
MAKNFNKNVDKNIALFGNDPVRRIWDEKEERWYFSVVDVVRVLADSSRPDAYWVAMKARVKSDDGIQLSTICRQLKLEASDGKRYQTDCANTEGVLRIIQSIPSPKAEPFKRWLAKVGQERIREINDPEIALNRSRELWQKHGRSESWIQRRMMGQETRNKLTDYWSEHDVKKGDEFAILTNIIHEEWSDLSVKKHKDLKGLKTQNLRDHMSEEELIFSALAEMSTRKIAETEQTAGLEANKIPAKKGGKIAKDARTALEEKTGQSVITGRNFLPKLKNK